ncbi:MAG: DinB family protein [Ardenticatenaceae bacterium]|nr:DinB family protein [Ardenticatenaceae bacterium]
MNSDQALRTQLVNMLLKRQAHMLFEDAVATFPLAHINTRPPQVGYSFWHLLEHIRICQYDILDYIGNPAYVAPNFPDDLWPASEADTDEKGWNRTIHEFYADRQALVDIVQSSDTNLYAPIPHGWDGHNILREILIVADHNAYHIGELAILRQVMGLW